LKEKGYGPILLILLLVFLQETEAFGAAIRDLRALRQDPRVYVDKTAADLPLLPIKEQERLNTEYDTLFFAPWHQTSPRHTLEQVSWGFKEYGNNPGYGKEGRRHPPDWVRKMAVNAHLSDYPQGGFPAITVKRVDFRILPTQDSHSNYPKPRSRDNPFDNLQESSAPEGAPVLVTQVSRDGKWVLAETSYALGWMPATDVAAVDAEFMQRWENGRYVAIIRDKAPVRDEKGVRCFSAPLGAVFPKIGEDASHLWILTAMRDRRGRALLRKARVEKSAVADKPLSFTALHAAQLAAELIGEPYGWGGLYGRRDCSSMIRDLFAPFGLWLARTSKEQAATGRFIAIQHLPPAERAARIIEQGVPWRTLLWTPGHIMLYIGVHQGEPLIFHNFWSVGTRDPGGNKRKLIVGRAAVTTLQPGREFSERDAPRTGVAGMAFLGERPEGGEAQLRSTP